MLAHHQCLKASLFEGCRSRKQEKSGFANRLWDRLLAGPCRYNSSRLGSIASLLSAPCWRIISFSKQCILRFAAAENKKRVVLRNGCEIDSFQGCVAVTLPAAWFQTDGLEKSQNAMVRGRQLCTQLSIFEGRLAELLRF